MSQPESRHLVRSGLLSLEVDPALAGRVTSLRLGERELLTGADVNPNNWGATYWTSPQSDWGWPPVVEVDSAAFEVLAASAEEVHLRGPEAAIGERRFHVHKLFRPGPGESVDVEYRIENVGDSTFSMANWEISRVAPAGLSFFPTGDAEIVKIAPHEVLPTEKKAGCTFYDHGAFQLGPSRKLHADGKEGFLGHVMGDLLLLKIFPDAPADAQAPGEGEVEIFANEDGAYVEIEVQGPYVEIAPGASTSFIVRTVAVPLPSDLTGSGARADLIGSAALLSFARAEVVRVGTPA